MKGMNAKTGEPIDDFEHLQQSLLDILSTPYGSRVMRRNYGAGLFQFVDMPINPYMINQMQSAIAQAVMTQETRFLLKEITVNVSSKSSQGVSGGSISVNLTGHYLIGQNAVSFNDLHIQF
jgi:uncharacterized protein